AFLKNMGIEFVALLGVPAPVGFGHIRNAAAVNGVGVFLHPFAHFFQNGHRFRGDLPFGVGANVQEHIAVFADAFQQVADDHSGGFIVVVGGAVAPVVV